MAPTDLQVQWQTGQVIQYLLADEDESQVRLFGCVEPDGPGDEDDGFDPVVIADKLREVADSFNDDPRFQATLSNFKKAAAQQAVEEAFSQGVDAVFQTQASKGAEVAPELQLIKASVALGLYIKRSSPELKNKVQSAMTAFLNQRVGSWVAQQGGWEIAIESGSL